MTGRPSLQHRTVRLLGIFVLIVILCLVPQFVSGLMQSSSGTSISVSASPTSIRLGENATFTATVNASVGTPTGLVTFFDGSTPLGSSILSVVGEDNQVTFSTSLLSATGSPHSVIAVYQGDS